VIVQARFLSFGCALVTMLVLLASVLSGCVPDTAATLSSTPTPAVASSTTSEPSTTWQQPATSTTLPPGVMTFDTLTRRFEMLVEHQGLAGTLPYSVLTTKELSWLSQAAPLVTVSEAKGYRFADGGLVIVLFCEPVAEDSQGEAQKTLVGLAEARYSRSAEEMWARVADGCGYLVVSEHYADKLGRLAQMAREGPPPEHYFEQLERPFDAVTERFEAWVAHEDLRGTLPFAVKPAGESAWLSQAVPEVTQANAYEFANDDLVILFDLAAFSSYDTAEAAWRAIDAAAKARYAGHGRMVWTFVDEDFGYVTVTASEDYRQEFGFGAGWARWAGPPDW